MTRGLTLPTRPSSPLDTRQPMMGRFRVSSWLTSSVTYLIAALVMLVNVVLVVQFLTPDEHGDSVSPPVYVAAAIYGVLYFVVCLRMASPASFRAICCCLFPPPATARYAPHPADPLLKPREPA